MIFCKDKLKKKRRSSIKVCRDILATKNLCVVHSFFSPRQGFVKVRAKRILLTLVWLVNSVECCHWNVSIYETCLILSSYICLSRRYDDSISNLSLEITWSAF
jgi:hypothetical protein